MGNLNIKKFIISMMIFFGFFVVMTIAFILFDVWEWWGKEVRLILLLGFVISAAINLLKVDNYKK